MKYIVSCNKMNSAKTLMNKFIERLHENNEISSVTESTKTVYLFNGDSYKFCTTKQRRNYPGRLIYEREFRKAVWNYNPVRDGKFILKY